MNLLRNRTDNTTANAIALSLYLSFIKDSISTMNSSYILTAQEFDEYVGNFDNTTVAINSSGSFIMIRQLNQDANVTNYRLGSFYTHNIGGGIIDGTYENGDYLNITAAATIGPDSLTGVTLVSILIIDDPLTYRMLNNSIDKTLASSVIVVAVHHNNVTTNSVNVSLFFQLSDVFKPNITDVDYYCSFYNITIGKWDESGCTRPIYNSNYSHYECSCDRTGSFALLWASTLSTTSIMTTTTTTTISPFNPNTCNSTDEIKLSNGPCVSKPDGAVGYR